MSYAEKPEDITREDWMDKLNNVHIQRADMNRLIMNYLVTGEVSIFILLFCVAMCGRLSSWFLFNRRLQGGSREV